MANPLARVVMDNISKKTHQGVENRSFVESSGNLTRKDEDIIKSLIYKEAKVNTNTVNKRMVTLEELARLVKGQ